MTHNSSVNFKLIPFLLWRKGSHQSPNFKSFKCSVENLPNFSCHFSNHESVLVQNLHNSSVSWKITPVYFCSSNNIYLAQKKPINNLIPLRILHHHLLSRYVTPLWILGSYFFYSGLKDPINIPVLRLSNAQLKICHVPHLIFQTTSQFFFKFGTALQCYER